jgi:formylglycine-generating enzyme required for sulfatase activity
MRPSPPSESPGRESERPALPGFADALGNLPRSGATLAGHRLLEYVGRGAQGEVWQARSLSGGPVVALKLFFRPGRAPQDLEETYNRLRAVLDRAKVVQHKNLVTIRDYGRADDLFWVAQEYVSTERNLQTALSEWAASPEPPPDRFRWAARWALGIARALEALHDARILHGDLKPGNVLLDAEGEAKVTDLGLARVLREGNQQRGHSVGFAGTTLYAAPEVVLELDSFNDARSDLYSLGVVLYELCALTRPVRGLSLKDAARGRISELPPPPRANDGVPEPLTRIVMRCLEPQPRWRYSSASDVAADLERYLADEPLKTRPVTKWVRLGRGVRGLWERPGARWRLVLGLVVLGLAAAWAQDQLGQRAKQTELEALKRLVVAAPDQSGLQARVACIQDLRSVSAQLQAGARTAVSDAVGNLLSADFAELPGGGFTWGLQRRLAAAEEAQRWFEGPSGEQAPAGEDAWIRAHDRLKEDARFAGWLPEPLPELYPLGPDPDSGLEEFWLITSGTRPVRDEAGRLALAPGQGLVLVLLPGGHYVRGVMQASTYPAATWETLRALDWERRALLDGPETNPAVPIEVTPFFLSKWELTQDQYQRLAGSNPSRFAPEREPNWHGDGRHPLTALHPVEQVSALEAERLLSMLGLELPSESRFEYALRAGQTGRWPQGQGVAELLSRPGVNLLDLAFARAWPLDCPEGWPVDSGYDDGYAVHGPVDLWSANGFGLVGMQGNVAEWCADDFDARCHLGQLTQEAWRNPAVAVLRAVRGGSYRSLPADLSCHARASWPAEQAGAEIGLRPMLRAAPRSGFRTLRAPRGGPEPVTIDAPLGNPPFDLNQMLQKSKQPPRNQVPEPR